MILQIGNLSLLSRLMLEPIVAERRSKNARKLGHFNAQAIIGMLDGKVLAKGQSGWQRLVARNVRAIGS